MDSIGCKYIFTRGPRKGHLCGISIDNDGTKGSDTYCRVCLSKNHVIKRLYITSD